MKAPQIILQNYEKLISEVKNHVEITAENISKIVTRRKVEMAWNIGKAVQSYLEQNNQSEKSSYGKYLFEKLESDCGIDKSVLYRMRSFYKNYPKIPSDDDKLNWNHYQILSGIKNQDHRQYLEDLTRSENLNAEQLRGKIKKVGKAENKKIEPKIMATKKLKFTRGKLFCYRVVQISELGISCVDCGFNVFFQLQNDTPDGVKIIETIKQGENFLAKETSAKMVNLNSYKAYLLRVVDGDTIEVVLDLGFKIFHREILRLRQIDAPEITSTDGKKSSEELKKILQNLPFLIVKTHSRDIYGRYLADVFLPNVTARFSEQQTVEEGEYLSQILLDANLAQPFTQ